MKLEDESLLSAQLDHELDAAERRQVEAALESDPALRESLRSLARTSELVSSLSRPAIPVDLTAGVLTRAFESKPRFNARRVYRASLWAASAASVLLAGLLASRSDLRPRPAGNRPTEIPRIETALTAAKPADVVPVIEGEDSGVPTHEIILTESASSAASPPKTVASNDLESPRERERLIELLSRPDLRRVVIPLDTLGGDSVERIDEIVRSTGRKDADYARFTLAQGLVLDPRNPNKAELFVVVVDQKERDLLLDSLKSAVPEMREVEDVDDIVAGTLAEAGRVVFHPGQRAAGLILEDPDLDRFAHKAHPAPKPNSVAVDIRGGYVSPSPTTVTPVEPTDSRPIIVDNESPAKSPSVAAADANRRVTLVLWVTSPAPSE